MKPNYDINAINKMALKVGAKPLTPIQFSKMSPKQIKGYINQAKSLRKETVRGMKQAGRQLRKNAKTVTSEEYKYKKLMHGTIRQGLAELGALASQGVTAGGAAAISRSVQANNAITQNTLGGTEVQTTTEKGPVYGKSSRDED